MADVRMMFEKDFIYAYDLQGRDVAVTIEKVTPGEVANKDKKTKKPIVYFKGSKKGLVLNITNVRTIGGMYGFKAEDWLGKRVTLYPTTTQFGRETVECIRVRPVPPKGKDTAAGLPESPPPEREVGGDDDDPHEAVA